MKSVETTLDPDVVLRHTTPGETLMVFLPFLFEMDNAARAVVIQKHAGDTGPPLNTVADCMYCMSGYVLATGRTREDAVAIGDRLVNFVQFSTTPQECAMFCACADG